MDITPDLARDAGELRMRMSRLARRLRQETDRQGLTMSQTTALSRLERGGPSTLSELAAGERIRPQSMARTLDALEAAGMVRRSPHPADRRQHMVAITDAGRAVIAEDRRGRDAWLARAMAAALSGAERDLLIRAGAVMERLADYVDDPAGTGRPGRADDPSGPDGPDGSGRAGGMAERGVPGGSGP